MTTWQDQPPLTRRQAREAERSQESAASPSPLTRRAVTTEPTAGGEAPQLVTPYTGTIDTIGTNNADGSGDSTDAADEKSDYDALLSGRPAVPNYSGSSFAAGSLTSAPPAPPQAPAEVAPSEAPSFTTPAAATTPEFRQRSYAPGGSAGLQAATAAPASGADSIDAETDAAVESDGTPMRTLTRRELRAMLAEQEAAAAAESAIEVVVSTPTAQPEAEPTASDTGRRVTWSPPVPESEAENRPVWETAQTGFSLPPTVAVPVVPSAPAPSALIAEVPAPAAEAPAPAVVVAPPVASPFDFGHTDDVLPPKPVGHWSIDADHEDDRDVTGAQPSFDQLLSRGIAAGGVSAGGVPTTTSALILPSIPQSGDGAVALTTGEVLVTGSFDLPRSLGSTGAHPDRVDSSEIDRLFELEDAGPATGAQPIRASRAVSGQTSTRDVIQPPQKQSRWTVPFILSISAGVLAVGVVALIIAGLVSGIF
ncbi:hypothetical protein WJX64_05340 [Leifsonia sp. YIM 134122]|uniref:Uncharacterized protein n=1 Tax=Leifsonia stereocauli TaxID=3134136 RepID=A0ABU9W1T9_9MICO